MDYPIVLKFKNQRVLIVGAGRTAYRKAKKIHSSKVDLTVYSPRFIPAFDGLSINRIKGTFSKKTLGILEGFDLIYAATNDSELNNAILDYCGNKRILVNSVTNQNSDFIVPASFNIGDLSISISTAGQAPFLSRHIKEMLEEKYNANYLDLLFKIRAAFKGTNNKDELYRLLKLDEEELRDYYEKNYCRG